MGSPPHSRFLSIICDSLSLWLPLDSLPGIPFGCGWIGVLGVSVQPRVAPGAFRNSYQSIRFMSPAQPGGTGIDIKAERARRARAHPLNPFETR